jgi:hypothetical protein
VNTPSLETPGHEELIGLFGQLVDDSLDADGRSRLASLVRSDAEARELYLAFMSVHVELHWKFGTAGERDEPAAAPVASSVEQSNAFVRVASALLGAIDWRRHPVPFLTTVALLTLAMWAGVLLFVRSQREPAWNNRAATLETNERPVVAHLLRSVDAQWSQGAGPMPNLAGLRQGQTLELAAGYAEIKFQSGANVVLEGPARLSLETGNQMRLDAGKLSARVGPSALGFTVITETTSVVDLGTEFTILRDDAGAVAVRVSEGEVAVRPRRVAGERRLTAGMSVQIDGDGRIVGKPSRQIEASLVGLPSSIETMVPLLSEDFNYQRPQSPLLAKQPGAYHGGSGAWTSSWRGTLQSRITGADHPTPNVAEASGFDSYLERSFATGAIDTSRPVYVRVDMRYQGHSEYPPKARIQFVGVGDDPLRDLGFGIEGSNAGLDDGRWHTLTAKIETDSQNRRSITVWVDPTQSETATQVLEKEVVTREPHLGHAVRLYTWSGDTLYDNLRIGSTWESVMPEHRSRPGAPQPDQPP